MAITSTKLSQEPKKRVLQYAPLISDVCQLTGENPYRLTALALRESGLGIGSGYSPKDDPTGWGDKGHAYGFFQIDKRYHKEFVESADAKDLKKQALYACKLLRDNRYWFERNSAIRTGDPNRLERMTYAAYNCGCHNVYKAIINNLDIDYYTTGKNYSFWVFNKAVTLFNLLPNLYVNVKMRDM